MRRRPPRTTRDTRRQTVRTRDGARVYRSPRTWQSSTARCFTIRPCRTSAESSNSTDATYPLYSIIAFSPSLLTIPGKSSGRIVRLMVLLQVPAASEHGPISVFRAPSASVQLFAHGFHDAGTHHPDASRGTVRVRTAAIACTCMAERRRRHGPRSLDPCRGGCRIIKRTQRTERRWR